MRLIFALMFFVIAGITLYVFWQNFKILIRGVKIKGVVNYIRQEHWQNGEGKEYRWILSYAFTAPNGQEIMEQTEIDATYPRSLKEGDSIDIYYDPKDVGNSTIAYSFRTRLFAFGLAGFGFLTGALICVYKAITIGIGSIG